MILKHTNTDVYIICAKPQKKYQKNRKQTKELCSYDILQARLCLCQVFSGSKQYEKVRHTNRISQYDLSTPRLSLLPHCPPPNLHSLLALLALGGTQEPLGPPGRVTAARASAHMF